MTHVFFFFIENTGADAAKLHIASQYITMYGEMGQKSNTMIFSDKPADINALLAQAASVISALPPKQ